MSRKHKYKVEFEIEVPDYIIRLKAGSPPLESPNVGGFWAYTGDKEGSSGFIPKGAVLTEIVDRSGWYRRKSKEPTATLYYWTEREIKAWEENRGNLAFLDGHDQFEEPKKMED